MKIEIENFSPRVKNFLKEMSKELNQPIEIIVEDILIAYLAKLDAEISLFGHYNRLLIEFMTDANGKPVGRDMLYYALRDYYKQQLKQQLPTEDEGKYENVIEEMKKEGILPDNYDELKTLTSDREISNLFNFYKKGVITLEDLKNRIARLL